MLAENEAELTDEEMAAFIKTPVDEKESSELSEEQMERVNGGIIGTLTTILGASWSYAVYTYGSPEAAIEGIDTFWYNFFKR